jgi:hypothetical protein
MDSRTENLKADLKRLHVETAERVVCRRLNALVGPEPRPLCGHRLFPGFPPCTLPADHAEPWHRHHRAER